MMGMEYDDLRSWIARVQGMGELREVDGATWQEDIGHASELLVHTLGAPAVLFDNIPGYPAGHRLLVNINATRSRLALTLGLPVDIERRPLMDEFLRLTESNRSQDVKVLDDAPIFENVRRGDDVNVFEFPTPQWHPLDGGRYIGTGCAIVCGMDPLIFAASTIEVPYGISEYQWAGAIRGEPYEVVNLPITGLPVPASSEIVLEGYIFPDKMAPEGPFGEWTGYYGALQPAEPVMTVEGMYWRNNPIMLGVPPNKPPAYDPYLYREYLRSAIMLRELRGTGIPGISDVQCFAEGGTRLFNAIAIEQKYAGHSRQTLHAAASVASAGYLGRIVVVVDDDIDVTDINDVLWAIFTRMDPERSIDIIKRLTSSPLDPALPPNDKRYNSRLLIDATRPFEWKDQFPIPIGPDAKTKAETRKRWGYLLSGTEAPPGVAR